MTKPKALGRLFFRVVCFVILNSSFVITSGAQETPSTTPKPGARLMFVPPPMEGTISMGIYDGAGKLVRALHRGEAVESDAFGKALNGLITSWDGKNDAGETMPAGKYFARGFMVGELGTEGEAMHGNDWIADDDSPRVSRIAGLVGMPGGVCVSTQISGSSAKWLPMDALGNPATLPDVFAEIVVVREGKVVRLTGTAAQEIALPALTRPVAACQGRDGSVWVIDRADSGTEVREYSPAGEFKRRLAIQPNDPQPVKIAASSSTDAVFLLEEDASSQRLRSLSLVTTGTTSVTGTETPPPPAPTGPATTSTWKVLFTKTITFSDTLDQARGLLKFPDGKPFEPQDKIRVSLLPNPLVQDQPGSVEISAGIDAEGSFLKTTDGLLLKRISDTPNLKWAVIGREPGSKIIVLFQSDGAVVEEYRIGRPANMMAFDCGDFEFDPAKMK